MMKSIFLIGLAFLCGLSGASTVQFEIKALHERASRQLPPSPVKMIPVVVNTWPFTNATKRAWEVVFAENKSALDAIEAGCTVCEDEQCDGTVGYGGSPDENGETALDAMIMDGPTHRIGAVGGMKRVKHAISVARKVMEHTEHTMLIAEAATAFAMRMGFPEENLSTDHSRDIFEQWRENNCQPNFWKNVLPDSSTSCGPYTPAEESKESVKHNFKKDSQSKETIISHDTIGMVAIDVNGNLASGTSTNGANHKIPGRLGDSAIPGSGSYVDQEIGAATATGDGDVLMRFLPSYAAVEYMGLGMTPVTAAQYSLQKIVKYYPDFNGAVVALKRNGEFGAACHGFDAFAYSAVNPDLGHPHITSVTCSQSEQSEPQN